MPKKQKLPPEIIELWPEIFEDVDLVAIPMDYIKKVTVQSTDGSAWEIKFEDSEHNDEEDIVGETIAEFMEEHEDEIEEILFEIDAEKVIKEAKEFSSKW